MWIGKMTPGFKSMLSAERSLGLNGQFSSLGAGYHASTAARGSGSFAKMRAQQAASRATNGIESVSRSGSGSMNGVNNAGLRAAGNTGAFAAPAAGTVTKGAKPVRNIPRAGNDTKFGAAMGQVGKAFGNLAGNHEGMMKSVGSSVISGATFGAFGGAMYNGGELATGGQGFQSKGVIAGAWQGAKYGLAHGMIGGAGKALRGGSWTGKYQGIATAGKMMRNVNGHWSTRGALRVASFANAGQTSLTRPINSQR